MINPYWFYIWKLLHYFREKKLNLLKKNDCIIAKNEVQFIARAKVMHGTNTLMRTIDNSRQTANKKYAYNSTVASWNKFGYSLERKESLLSLCCWLAYTILYNCVFAEKIYRFYFHSYSCSCLTGNLSLDKYSSFFLHHQHLFAILCIYPRTINNSTIL